MNIMVEIACNQIQKDHCLTKAENSVVYLLAQGYSAREIAEIRSRSIETVRTQIKSVKDKLSVNKTSRIPAMVLSYVGKETRVAA